MADVPAITSHPHSAPLSTLLSPQHPYRTIPRPTLSPSQLSAPLPTPHLPPPPAPPRAQHSPHHHHHHHHHQQQQQQQHPHHLPPSDNQYPHPSYTSQLDHRQLDHRRQYPANAHPALPTILSAQSTVPRQICNPVTTHAPTEVPTLHRPHTLTPHFPSTDHHPSPQLPQQPAKYRRLETTTHVSAIRRLGSPTTTHLPATTSFNYPVLSSTPRSRYEPTPPRDDGYSTGSRETAPAPDALEDDHDVEAPYTCAHCAARFTDRDQRKNHIKTAHEKPFVCTACNSRFTRKFDLEKHSLTVHEGMRPFQCDVCPSSFGQKHHLVRHKRAVHAKARDFACDSCSARFARKEHLGNHKRAVHEKHKPYLCSLCDVQYYERRALRKHLEQVHSVKSSRASMLAEWQPNGSGNTLTIQELVQM